MRLGIRFDVEQEARFLSHHEMMRLMTRAAVRAELPLRFTEGFNPHPKVALPLPRPVGVAARDELFAVELTDPVEPTETTQRLSRQLPEGVCVTACGEIPGRKAPHAAWATFVLPIARERRQTLQQRLANLDAQPTWPCRRQTAKRGKADRTLDLRQYAGGLRLAAGRLTFRLTARGQVWARVEEVLDLLGLDVQLDRAALCRTKVGWTDLASPTPTPSPHE